MIRMNRLEFDDELRWVKSLTVNGDLSTHSPLVRFRTGFIGVQCSKLLFDVYDSSLSWPKKKRSWDPCEYWSPCGRYRWHSRGPGVSFATIRANDGRITVDTDDLPIKKTWNSISQLPLDAGHSRWHFDTAVDQCLGVPDSIRCVHLFAKDPPVGVSFFLWSPLELTAVTPKWWQLHTYNNS